MRMQENMKEYLTQKETREKRLAVYTEKIQETVLNKSAETIRLLVEERHRALGSDTNVVNLSPEC